MCVTGNPEEPHVRIIKSQTGTFSISVLLKKGIRFLQISGSHSPPLSEDT